MMRSLVLLWLAVMLLVALPAQAQIGPAPPPSYQGGTIVPPGLTVNDGYLTRAQAPFQTIAETGTYRISIYFTITFAVQGISGDNSITVYWTDISNTQRSVVSPAISRAGGYYQNTIIARVQGGTTLDYSTLNFNGSAGVNTQYYNIVVEKLS